MAENPKVHSKGMTYHGKPRSPGHVEGPGEQVVGGSPSVHPVSHGTRSTEHKSVHYHPHDHGRMHHGHHAVHPTHGSEHPNESSDSGGYEGP